jgi:predicted  nucleic acid-binding Zn-ribbon protein
MGVYKKVDNAPKTDGYDQVGVSTGQIAAIGQGALETIKEMEGQVAALDKEIRTLDEQIAELNEELGEGANYAADAEGGSSRALERFTLAEKRSTLAAERAAADQRLVDYAVSSIKFTRQSSFQNMDAFLKKIGGK